MKKSIFGMKLFWILFCIPSVLLTLLFGIVVIYSQNDIDALTWSDAIITDILMISLWFVIVVVFCAIIKFIMNKIKRDVINEVDDDNANSNNVNLTEIVDSKIVKKTSKKNKCLYAYDEELTSYEYRKLSKYFPNIYYSLIFYGTICNIILTALLAIISNTPKEPIVFFIVFEISVLIIYRVCLGYFSEKIFDINVKRGQIAPLIHTEFYQDYFIRSSEMVTFKINYSDIDKVIETDTNFYLKSSSKRRIFIVQKNCCELELITFIRKTFNIENHLGNNFKVRKYHHPNFTKNFMIILFVLTLLTLYFSSFALSIVDSLIPQYGFSFTKNYWVYWCFLPIPILSIVLGYKYNRAGFKCTKNIVAGFIISFYLLATGVFCLFPTYEVDYSEIYNYSDVVDVTLPSSGVLEIEEWGTYFDEDKTEYVIINAYYDRKDVDSFVNDIKMSDNWFLSTETKSYLKVFIPSTFISDEDTYYSIYNKTLEKYNAIPSESGNYEIYAMEYDISDKLLEIHKFKYYYNK